MTTVFGTPDRRHHARGRTVAVRVDAAQLHSGRRRGRHRRGGAKRASYARATVPVPGSVDISVIQLGAGCWIGVSRRASVRRVDAAGLRLRGPLPRTSDPLDVVAVDRRPGGRHRRPDRTAGPQCRIRQHFGNAPRRRRAESGADAARGQSDHLVGRARLRHLGRRARAAPDHGRRDGHRAERLSPVSQPGLLGAARHGGDYGRHDALAADGYFLRRRADRQHARAAAVDRRVRRGPRGDRCC